MRTLLTGWFLLALLLGCQSSQAAPPSAPSPAPSAPQAPAAPRAALTGALALPAAELVVAIGDLHGDLANTRRALRLAGALDAADHWSGGTRTVVQTGDAIDRGDEDRDVLDLLERLRKEAKQAGGAFLPLSGNHEVMNVAHDFRYVTAKSFAEFTDEAGRVAAFEPGGPYARMLAERPIFLKVGDSLFVHGGVLPKHVEYGLDRMAREMRAWMLGERSLPPAIAVEEDGPIWTRFYSGTDQPDCAQLSRVLAAVGAKRMVVGHTVQRTGINSLCDGKLWRIDVGLSRYYGGPVQVLEIRADSTRVLQEAPAFQPAP